MIDSESNCQFILATVNLDLTGTKTLYLKCTYETIDNPVENPITEINFYHIKNLPADKHILIKPETDIIEPIPIGTYPHQASSKIEHAVVGKYKKNVVIYKGNYDLSEILKAEVGENICLVFMTIKQCMCCKREAKQYPIYDVKVKISDKSGVLSMPPNYQGILFKMGEQRNRFACYSHSLPSDVTFEPEIIDRYPLTDRHEFPFYNEVHKVN